MYYFLRNIDKDSVFEGQIKLNQSTFALIENQC